MIALDHLVYTTPDLDAAIVDLEQRLGVRAAYGGRHPGRGTRNALIALSESSYLEIVGPDLEQRDVARPRWFGLGSANVPRLATWAAACSNLEDVVAEAARQGVVLGQIDGGSRQTTEGSMLHWRFTEPDVVIEDGLVPFLIDWGNSPHPAQSAPRGPAFVSLRAEHPAPDRVARALSAIGLTIPVAHGSQPALIATLRTTSGDVELR